MNRRIIGPVYYNEKENWMISTNKEMYEIVKQTYHNRDCVGLDMFREWKETEFPKEYCI
jgi:hypothetical protein